MTRSVPDWFVVGEEANPEVMRRIAHEVSSTNLHLQVRSAPMLAHWFLLDALLLSNQANREGMHANALALTRQCVESISIVELGICRHPDAEQVLLNWDADRLNPGKLRGWLATNVWPQYGTGLWLESWTEFMKEFAAAVQPYAHYGTNLAQWQVRLHSVANRRDSSEGGHHAIIEMKPRAYDPQKATRITLFCKKWGQSRFIV